MAEMNLRNLPPGVRFCPNDIELIRYVERKNDGYNDFIPVYDISQCKPDQLPQDSSTRGKKGELYFFVKRDPNKSRQKRSVDKEFFWRTTNSIMITDEAGTVKGQKTSLVFHSGRGRKGTKTEWMMQEYCLINAAASPEGYSSSAKDKKMEKVGKFVLHKIYKKATTEGETDEVSFNPIEDELVDEYRNDGIAFWWNIHEHADDENILSYFPG